MRPCIACIVAMVASSSPAFAAPASTKERIAHAENIERELRAHPERLRLRHNIEKLTRAWDRAIASSRSRDRARALERKAEALRLLAHWSGLSADRARAETAKRAIADARIAALPSKSPRPKEEKKAEARVEPAGEHLDPSEVARELADALAWIRASDVAGSDIEAKTSTSLDAVANRADEEVDTTLDDDDDETPERGAPRSLRTIVIDAGHGGKDCGARGPGGVIEKNVNLAIAKRVGRELERATGARIVYTRSSDRFVSLRTRSEIANAKNADLFLSIHANAHRDRTIRGIETYYVDARRARFAHRTTERPRQIAARGDGVHRRSRDSLRLAKSLQTAMVASLRSGRGGVRDLGVKHALFYVLLGSRMPSVLIETGFVTNRDEGRRLLDANYQRSLARAIAGGVQQFARGRELLAQSDRSGLVGAARAAP